MKLDLRILNGVNTSRVDLCVGNFAKKAYRSKLYNDRLKVVTLSMHRLNILLRSGLPAKDAVIPLIQAMGFECQLYILKVVNSFYVLKQVEAITYPTMHKVLYKKR